MNAPCRSARSLHGTLGWLWISVMVFLHSDTSLISVPSSSVFHASSAACHLAITSIIFYTLQLSSHCLRIQPLHSQGIRTTTACGLPKKTMLRHGVCACMRGTWTEDQNFLVASLSAFWFLQGDVACNQGPRPTKLPDCMGYRAWSALPTGSIFQFVWQAAKPITAQPFFHVCAIGAIWDCGEGQLYRFISLDILHWILVTVQFHITIR